MSATEMLANSGVYLGQVAQPVAVFTEAPVLRCRVRVETNSFVETLFGPLPTGHGATLATTSSRSAVAGLSQPQCVRT